KDDAGVFANQLKNIKTGELGHLHVKENQVGLVLGERLDRFESICALGNHCDLWMRNEQFADDVTREFFVVYNRSEEHTSELQSRSDIVCRLLLDIKKVDPTA